MSIFSSADIASFKNDRLLTVASSYFPGVTLSDDYLLSKLQTAEQAISRELRVLLEPTTVFAYTPSADEIATVSGPWIEESSYDYDMSFFGGDAYGFIRTRQHPVISVDEIRFVYPAPTNSFTVIPADWIRVDKKYGDIRLVPGSSSFAAPLGAFALSVLNGGRVVPAAIHVRYHAGLSDVRTKWLDLVDAIYKQAALNLIQESFLPSSGSISADGLSESMSVDMGKYDEMIERKLFGPKGANGGLYAAIHGVSNMVLGVL